MSENNEKILQVVGGMGIGGTETMLMNLYREVHNIFQFDFISYYENEAYYDKEIESLGGKVIKTELPRKVGQVKSITNLYKIIKEGNYDIVHAHTLFNCGSAMIAAKLAGVKIRISHAHTNLDMEKSFIKKYYFLVMRYLINSNSTNLLACSNSAGRYLFGTDIGKEKKYKILPNYVDYKKFLDCNDKNSIRKELGVRSDDILVGHIGRFVDAKNHKFLIEVLNEMMRKDCNVKAALVGDGPLREEIQDKVNELGISNNIHFLGLRNDTEVILNNCDLFIFPSIYEGLGLVMLEAQACGLPCLVSEAIQPEADLGIGLVKQISLKDGKEKWCKQALKLSKRKNKNKEEIENAFISKGYNLDKIVDNLLEIYKQ